MRKEREDVGLCVGERRGGRKEGRKEDTRWIVYIIPLLESNFEYSGRYKREAGRLGDT